MWHIFRIIEPYATSNLVFYFTPGQTEITQNMAYYYAAIVILVNISISVFLNNYGMFVQQLAVEIKTAFSSLIYRKTLKLTPSALSEISLGNIVTLITKDVNMFEQSIWMINEMWMGIVQTCVLCYLLYSSIGATSFIGLGVLMSIMPIQCEYFCVFYWTFKIFLRRICEALRENLTFSCFHLLDVPWVLYLLYQLRIFPSASTGDFFSCMKMSIIFFYCTPHHAS